MTLSRAGAFTEAPSSASAQPLPRAWFERDALVVARALVGCNLVREVGAGAAPLVARIVETEAYRGPRDLACHARAGLTKRTRSLLGGPGRAYVFLVYGMHDCFNVTCLREGQGHAVLLRAAEPLAGIDPSRRLDGPGRLARALELTRALDGQDLTSPPLYFVARPAGQPRLRIAATPRVGVGYAGAWAERPWRFVDAESRCVSKPPRGALGRSA